MNTFSVANSEERISTGRVELRSVTKSRVSDVKTVHNIVYTKTKWLRSLPFGSFTSTMIRKRATLITASLRTPYTYRVLSQHEKGKEQH